MLGTSLRSFAQPTAGLAQSRRLGRAKRAQRYGVHENTLFRRLRQAST